MVIDIFLKVPLFSRASLVETTLATATRRTATIPRTKSGSCKDTSSLTRTGAKMAQSNPQRSSKNSPKRA